MLLSAASPEAFLDFSLDDMSALVRGHFLNGIAPLHDSRNVYPMPGIWADSLVVRAEYASQDYLPGRHEDNIDLISDWFEPELANLRSKGVATLPHHTYVVSDYLDPQGSHMPTTIYTVTKKVIGYTTLVDKTDHVRDMTHMSPRNFQAAKQLARSLAAYYHSHDFDQGPGSNAIDDIEYLWQWTATEICGRLFPTLLDYDHRRTTQYTRMPTNVKRGWVKFWSEQIDVK